MASRPVETVAGCWPVPPVAMVAQPAMVLTALGSAVTAFYNHTQIYACASIIMCEMPILRLSPESTCEGREGYMRSLPCGPAMRTPLASPRRSPFHGRTDHALPSHGVMGRVLNDWTSFSPALSSSIGVLDIDMQGTVGT